MSFLSEAVKGFDYDFLPFLVRMAKKKGWVRQSNKFVKNNTAITFLKRGGKVYVEIGPKVHPIEVPRDFYQGTIAFFLRDPKGKRFFENFREAQKAAYRFMEKRDQQTESRQTFHAKNGRFTSQNSAHTVTRGGERFKMVRQLRRIGGRPPEPEPENDVVDTVEEAKAKELVTSFLTVSPGWARLDDIVEGVFGEATIQGFKIPTPTQVVNKLYDKGKIQAHTLQYPDRSKESLLIRGKILGYMDDNKIKVNKTNLRKLKKQAYELSRELGVKSVGDFQGVLGQMLGDLEGLKDYKRQLAKAERKLDNLYGGATRDRTRTMYVSRLASSGSLHDEIARLKNKIADIEAMQSMKRVKIPASKKPKVMSKDAYLGKHGVSGHYVDVGAQSPGIRSKRAARAEKRR